MKLKRIAIAPLLVGALLAGCKEPENKIVEANPTSSFLIKLKDNNSSLKLATNSDFNEASKKLVKQDLPGFTEAFTYQWFLNTQKGYTFDKVHSENTNYTLGLTSKKDGLMFLKHTFFVKNEGDSNSSFTMDIELADQNVNYIEYLRLAVFNGTNTPTIYALRSKTRYDSSREIYKEYVSGPEGTVNYFGEAELFETETVLTTVSNSLSANETKMVTLLFWLEGEDAQCIDLPKDAYLNVKVNIN